MVYRPIWSTKIKTNDWNEKSLLPRFGFTESLPISFVVVEIKMIVEMEVAEVAEIMFIV